MRKKLAASVLLLLFVCMLFTPFAVVLAHTPAHYFGGHDYEPQQYVRIEFPIRPARTQVVSRDTLARHDIYMWAEAWFVDGLPASEGEGIIKGPFRVPLSADQRHDWPTRARFFRSIDCAMHIPIRDGAYDLYVTHGLNGSKSDDYHVRIINGEITEDSEDIGPFKFFANSDDAEEGVTYPAPIDPSPPDPPGYPDYPGEDVPDEPDLPYETPWRDEDIYIPGVTDEGDSVWDSDPVDDPYSYWGDVHSDQSTFNKILVNAVQGFMWGIWRFLGIHDPVTLFFNVSPEHIFSRYHPEMGDREIDPDKLASSLYVDPDGAFLFMFSDQEESMIKSIFGIFSSYLMIPYAVAVAVVGAWLVLGGFSAEDKSSAKVLLIGIALFPFLLRVMPYLLEPLFWVNDMIVRALGSYLWSHPELGVGGRAVLSRPFVTILISSGSGIGSIGVAIATLCLVIMAAILNFQYFVRRFMLALLLMMFPIVAFLQIFPGTRQTFRMWWSEFSANLFLQSAHAMVYVLFAMYVYEANLPLVPVLAMLATLSTLTIFIRNLMGCRPGSGVAGMAGGIIGISAFMGAARIMGGVVGGLGKGRYSTEPPSGSSGNQAARGSSDGTTALGAASGGSRGPGGDSGGPGDDSSGPSGGPGGDSGGPGGDSGGDSGGTPTLVDRHGNPMSSRESRESGGDTLTGPVWGTRPRVEPASIGRGIGGVAAKGAMGLGVLTGAVAGGAAMGPAGLGLGAMAGSKAAGVGVRAADRTVGVAGNYYARRQIVNNVMDKYGGEFGGDDGRSRATVFAATGVNATPREIAFDDTMRQQYSNFTDCTGFGHYRQQLDDAYRNYTSRDQNEIDLYNNVRTAAAREREEYMRTNPSAPPHDVNNHILNEVIRPRIPSESNRGN